MYHRLINEEELEESLPYQDKNDQNNFELKNRHSKERRPLELGGETESHKVSKIDFIYHTIKPNETLQGIALKYNCTVSQLRLHNHLMSDNTFHGLTVLKIPVVRSSILTEQLATSEPSTSAGEQRTEFVEDLVDLSDDTGGTGASIPKTQVIKIGISNYLNSNSSDDYKKFLNNLGEDFKEIRKSIQVKMEDSSIAAPLPIQVDGDHPAVGLINSTVPTKAASSVFLSCDGSDFGIHWRYLIILLIFVCFLVPSYVLFNLEHHNSTSSHPG
ncbi:PREDICTED: lysM and putative peptidoglycan-binding domain-containing protein 3-like [Rhagoletis zephyria]|uniref:lysM and putative peptidoglycan-binding domain-containing protein 3-like n=1 Tax=Rhagoletis zephyria TaxID=28612 RepID=UPI0008119593|nr:PREDICTED: lysM and putative peptidoglycan-binding domain-containing protein 3-like [Rhagoletis zephyria]KAH9400585.1 LysM and putative peptidoglycan-binding domain-containing protein 3 [Tyrophagus putrescentiae]